METKIVKKRLLKAMRVVVREYKTMEHDANVDNCSLCKLYMNYASLEADLSRNPKKNCKNCPMFVFYDGNTEYFPCSNRMCEPIDTRNVTNDDVRVNAVILFYQYAIKVVKTKTTAELNEKGAFKFLKKLDDKAWKNR